MGDSGILLAWVLDALALGAVVVVAVAVPLLVARDARQRGSSWARALGRGLATLAVLPLGLGLCLLLGWAPSEKGEAQA